MLHWKKGHENLRQSMHLQVVHKFAWEKKSNMHGFVLCCHKKQNCAQERVKAHICQKKLFDLPYCSNLNLLIRSGENKVASSFPW